MSLFHFSGNGSSQRQFVFTRIPFIWVVKTARNMSGKNGEVNNNFLTYANLFQLDKIRRVLSTLVDSGGCPLSNNKDTGNCQHCYGLSEQIIQF